MKKMRRSIYVMVLAAALATVWTFTGCSDKGDLSSEASVPQTAPVGPDTQGVDDRLEAKAIVRVGALKGPTGMGLVWLMEQNEVGATLNIYDFDELAGEPQEIVNKVAKGELDVAALPTNVAANLYQKTGGGVSILAVNTLGNLYIVQRQGEDEDEVESLEDLAGTTLYATGQGASPEYVLNYILAQNEVEDVTVEFRSEHTELAGLMAAGMAELALLPEPFASTAMARDEDIARKVDITAEWEKATGGVKLTTGCIVARTAFLEENPAAVGKFLEEYAASTSYVTDNLTEAAELVGKYDIAAAEVAEKAIPYCNIVCLTGEDMKNAVETYLRIIYGANPDSVGGALPDDSFYYVP